MNVRLLEYHEALPDFLRRPFAYGETIEAPLALPAPPKQPAEPVGPPPPEPAGPPPPQPAPPGVSAAAASSSHSSGSASSSAAAVSRPSLEERIAALGDKLSETTDELREGIRNLAARVAFLESMMSGDKLEKEEGEP